MLSAFVKNLNAGSTRVYSPKPFVLLCGGAVSNITDPKPISLRDAFLRSDFSQAIKAAEVLQIEEIQEYFEKDCPYKELVSFENDIAALSDLVVLFPEGPGSFAELGAFTAYPSITEKLLVVIQAKYINKSSFIFKGPIAFLKNSNERSVFSITNTETGIRGSDFSGVNPSKVLSLLRPHIDDRLEQAKDRTTFQKREFSHHCKLYVGLLREFSVLKDHELIELFTAFGVNLSKKKLEKITFCCRCVGWASTGQSGFDRVHFALNEKEAARLTLGGEMKDKLRRRIDIRSHWQESDPTRIATQLEATSL